MKGSVVRIVLMVAAVASVALLPMVAASRSGDPLPREVRIVAKDMAFYVNGEQTPNPTLRFKAGERIRLVLRNEDTGMTHDFVIKEWNVATGTLTDKGAEDTIVFRVPKQRASTAYRCSPHSEMMRGSVHID
jgi:FtsP/CotA-like multicopper oxidase with cupredoxin domain